MRQQAFLKMSSENGDNTVSGRTSTQSPKDLTRQAGIDKFDRVFVEELAITISVLKWVALATCVGVIVGGSTAGFLKLLQISTESIGQYRWYFLLLPGAFFASLGLVRWLAPEAEGHGTEKVIEAVHERSGRIKLAVVPVKAVAKIITIACGGSVGKEAP